MFWPFGKVKRAELVYRENLELSYEVKVLRRELELREEKWSKCWKSIDDARRSEIANWKERGDKYAAHNGVLQKSLGDIHTLVAQILSNPERLGAYKDILEKMTQPKPKAGE